MSFMLVNSLKWYVVDTSRPDVTRTFEVFGTGECMLFDMGIKREYIGTVKLQEGSLIYHVYERVN